MAEEEVEGQSRGLDYERFCNYPNSEVLGMEVQDQYLYMVQPYKISVYEYYGQVKNPQLIEELIYNKLILNYSINSLYICIQTGSFVEVRDRHNWNLLVHTHPLPYNQTQLIMILQKHTLYISAMDTQQLQFQRIDITTKESINVLDLGPINPQKGLTYSHKQPLFIPHMGLLEDFYVWGRDNETIQFGMFYIHQGKLKKKFQISSISLKSTNIRGYFNHKVKYGCKEVQYLIVVAQYAKSKQLFLVLYEILPHFLASGHQKEAINCQEMINQQLTHLGQINEENGRTSLVSQLLGEEFKQSHFQTKVEVALNQLYNFESSLYRNNKLWIFTDQKMCEIQFATEIHLEQVVKKGYPRSPNIINSIRYQQKERGKKAKAIYQNNFLFLEQTTTFSIGTSKDRSESIAEQIMEEADLQENLDGANNSYEAMQELCNSVIDIALNERQSQPGKISQLTHGGFSRQPPDSPTNKTNTIESKVYSESHHHLPVKTHQFSVQTDMAHKINDLQEIEMLVAKYSSTFSVSCSKIKQNQFQKDKFDKEIVILVESMAKTMIEPYLEQKFVCLLDKKVKEISETIGLVLRQQLQVLNQTMRKIQIKENNSRGKRIYQYTKQVQNIKTAFEGVIDSIKDRQINKFACNQLILQEAKTIKNKVCTIQKEITSQFVKQDAAESQMQVQIAEITELMTKLNSIPRKDVEDSEAEMCESDEEGSQGLEEEGSEGSDSQRSSSIQGNQHQGNRGYQYPKPHPSHHYPYHEPPMQVDSKRYPMPGYYPQFMHPPQPPTPFYYPYGPSPATVPFPPYYSSSIQPHHMIRPDKSHSSVVSRKDKDKKVHRKRNK